MPSADVALSITVPRCPLCDSGESELVYPVRDRLHGMSGEFALRRCQGCGLVRLSPRPAPGALPAFYPAGYYTHWAPALEEIRARGLRYSSSGRIELRINHLLQELAWAHLGYRPEAGFIRTRAGGLVLKTLGPLGTCRMPGIPPRELGTRALDVGCGSGEFLCLLRFLGWETVGIEPDAAAVAVARRQYGLDVRSGTLPDADLPSGAFHYVRSCHVIEHVEDPIGELRQIAEALAPGGRLYIETPNAAAHNASRMGPNWLGWESPRHLQIFDPVTLASALREAGLDVMSTATVNQAAILRFAAVFEDEEGEGSDAVASRDPRAFSPTVRSVLRWIGLETGRRLLPANRLSGDFLSIWARKP
jgi:2-polyprenyl-3-methyl-5-hydroxy-6-metoxy-1,4-benzoquinol methylase